MNEVLLKSICGSMEHPLTIGNASIQCYVLENEKRVLVQGEMINALGMSHGGSGGSGGDRLAKFVAGKLISQFVSQELRDRTANPIKFKTDKGNLAYGYEATVLADICEAVLDARNADVLQIQQKHIAKQCEILMRGFARVGIIALVDEATGFQDLRAKRALAEILEKYIAKELQEWTKTFPDEFYKEMFRLRGWTYDPSTVRRPKVIGKYTNDIVYDRLAPDILDQLRQRTPKTPAGNRRYRYFQWLTGNIGHPKLREHISNVLIIMKLSQNWRSFISKLNRVLPRLNDTYEIPFDEDDE